MDGSMSGNMGGELASKGKRFGAAAIDLIVIPIVLGLILGILILHLPEGVKNIILVVVNIAWLIFRDLVYSPGRALVKIKLVSLTGEKVSASQALIRNILIAIPFVLLIGYIVEIIALATRGERLADAWAKTRVVAA